MLVAGSFEVPDKCPEDCPLHESLFHQGSTCTRCPVFNCRKDADGFCLVDPENYHPDWAREFSEFFASGYKRAPQLFLARDSDDQA